MNWGDTAEGKETSSENAIHNVAASGSFPESHENLLPWVRTPNKQLGPTIRASWIFLPSQNRRQLIVPKIFGGWIPSTTDSIATDGERRTSSTYTPQRMTGQILGYVPCGRGFLVSWVSVTTLPPVRVLPHRSLHHDTHHTSDRQMPQSPCPLPCWSSVRRVELQRLLGDENVFQPLGSPTFSGEVNRRKRY
ncbi:hypothetical protein BJX96DRAFT_151043 [Aspergillus floccosus]